MHDVFNFLTAYAEKAHYKPLLVAPKDMAKTCIALIEREARHARRGRPARIIAKCNAVVDPPMIRALYRASQAGVEIDLIVRGQCTLVPGLRGISSRIRVRSIVGRFLEHSRIFYFENGGKPEIYLGSADWMPRNLYERVEVLFPLKDELLRQRICQEILPAYLADNVKARVLGADGEYTYCEPRAQGQRLFRAESSDGAGARTKVTVLQRPGKWPRGSPIIRVRKSPPPQIPRRLPKKSRIPRMRPFDLVVIGSGPGGLRAAIQASKIGKSVAVVEKQTMVGGICINSGTIPSKTMREAVLHLSGFYDQAFYGANYHAKENVTMSDLNFRVNRVIENEAAVLQDQLRRNNIELFHGTASFTDPHHLRVENSIGFSELEAAYVVVATGTKPAVNEKVPINGRNIINSDQILTMPLVPRTMIVVGGGVIGVEYACMWATLGVRVIIVEKRPRLLEFADAEMVEALSYHMRDRRATMRLNEEVESVEETSRRQGGRQSGQQQTDRWRCVALRRWAPGQRGPAESCRRGN